MKFVLGLLSAVIICGIAEEGHHSPGVGVINEEQEYDHEAFDQEIFAGGADQRKQLRDLSPEEAAKEIRKLVSRIDDGGDGKLSKEEIVSWLKKVENHSYRTEAEELFDKEDTDDDGFITFEEYWKNSEDEELPDDVNELNDAQEGVGLRFSSADTNKDGQLDKEEFLPFIHPFRHEHMMGHLVEDQLVMYDEDQDGMISFDEFTNSFNPEQLPLDELPDWVEIEREDFKKTFDKNGDGLLDQEEIKGWLAPDEQTFHEEEAQHLITHADKDKDGFLSLEEVEAEFDIFVDSSITDYGHVIHEEL